MMAQMTLRQIPDAVEKGLRLRARKTGRSLNRATIDLIEESLGVRPADKKRRDLSGVAGQWKAEECEAFERNTRVFERIDQETWKP
jgi:plasmid stability protein